MSLNLIESGSVQTVQCHDEGASFPVLIFLTAGIRFNDIDTSPFSGCIIV